MTAADVPVSLAPDVLAAALQHAEIGVLVTDESRRVLYVNAAFTRDTGYTLDDARGRTCAFLQGPGTDPADVQAIRAALDRAERVERVILNYRKDGRPLWYKLRITPIFQNGALRYFVGVQEDYTSTRELQARLEHAANADHLTQLGNRRAFHATLDALERQGRAFAVVIVDVNDLKRTNDQHGHASGDALLVRVARALEATLQPDDRAFRIGGDEFALLLSSPPATSGLELAARVRLALPDLNVAVGATLVPDEQPDAWQAVRQADQLMYACKAFSKSGDSRGPRD